LTSEHAIIGRKRQNSMNNVRNNPKVPAKVMMSTLVGLYIAQLDGRNSRCRLVAMMTKRSNHMPASTSRATAMVAHRLVRSDLIQKICGLTTLQKIMQA
jgi:hypothetical protein